MRAPLVARLLLLTLALSIPDRVPAEQLATPAADGRDLAGQMISIQIGHIKLWFAGKFGNWRLATYELDRLAAGLEDAGKHGQQAGSTENTAAITSLRRAIELEDRQAFIKAFSDLTVACNDCHRAADRGFIGIQVPAVSPFSDQDFADHVTEGRTLADTVCGVCHAVPDKPTATLAMGFRAPSFTELVRRPSFTEAGLRQFLADDHRRLGPAKAMPNPRLDDSQIEAIAAYFAVLKADKK